jgi:hypothetical protein
MPKPASAALNSWLGSRRARLFTTDSLRMGDRLVVGAVATPRLLRILPIKTLLLSPERLDQFVSNRRSRQFRQLTKAHAAHQIHVFQDTPYRFCVIANHALRPSHLAFAHLDRNAYPAFAFHFPFRAQETFDAALLDGAWQTYATHPEAPSELFVLFETDVQLQAFFVSLRNFYLKTAEIDLEERARVYLEMRSRPDSADYESLYATTAFSERPFHLADDYTGRLEAAPLEGPQQGDVRLHSDAIVAQALSLVPAWLRKLNDELPSPFLIARLRYRNSGSQSGTPSFYAPIGYSANLFSDAASNRCIVGEIGILDIPRDRLESAGSLVYHVFGQTMPYQLSQALEEDGHISLPDAVRRRFDDECPRAENFYFDTRQFDLMLIHQVLHECAEILWHVLDPSDQRRWMQDFPLEGDGYRSTVYYRNLLRVHTEMDPVRGKDGMRSSFAQETFADALALYWAGDQIPELLAKPNARLIRETQPYFAALMASLLIRCRERGSAFVLDETSEL